MARPKSEQSLIKEEEITQAGNGTQKPSLAEKGIFFLYDNKTLDKQGNPKRIELKSFETAKTLLINNNFRYEAKEAKDFWDKNLTQREKEIMTSKFNKANLRNKEIELGNLKQTR